MQKGAIHAQCVKILPAHKILSPDTHGKTLQTRWFHTGSSTGTSDAISSSVGKTLNRGGRMNDETKPAESSPNPPPESQPAPVRVRAGDRPLSYWVKKFLICNPFYLASAALLLFGLYRVSLDPSFLPEEVAQLKFNFTSLQLYELLLVSTAMLLARRLIWYDAKLLVTLENLLVLVPFMLVSQAALIEPKTVWIFCGAAALFAVARSGLAQRGVAALRFPPRLMWVGAGVLAVNAAWPVIYRILHENKIGKKLESGAAFEMNAVSWLVLLPALIALANLLPRPREDGKSPAPGRRFAVGLFTLWLLGSVVHLYALGYIYDFDLRCEWLAPALWVLAWTLHLRLPAHVESLAPLARKLTLILPLPVTLLAATATGSNVFFTLNALNLLAFGWVVWTERDRRLARQLTLLSFTAVAAAAPPPLCQFITGWFNRPDLIGLATLTYVMVASLLTRNPKAAIAGAIAAGIAGGALREPHGDAWHWAAQIGVVFFLLHSLRWRDYEHQGTAAVRIFMAVCWLVHSVVWLRDDATVWHSLIAAGAVLTVCGLRGLIFQRWTPLVVPGMAVGVALCGPLNLLLTKLQTTPVGLLALGGSLVLFAIGTAAALTKHRWHKTGDDLSP
jgi:hypothetical protein